MSPRFPTKTTRSPAADKVLNIPELLEQILYFAIITRPSDLSQSCKTANILRYTSSKWANLIDTSPILSTLAFRNRKLPANSRGDICIPFLESLKFELSEISQMRVYQNSILGLGDLKKFTSAQKTHTSFPKLRQAIGLPKYPTSTTKYLLSDIQLTQPPSPETVNTYLHFSGWGNKRWKESLAQYSRPEDLYLPGNSIEFKYWYKVTGASDGRITAADIVKALTKALATFYTFKGGFFEILHIELVVGSFVSHGRSTTIDYLYRWYLWHPERYGSRKDVVDFAMLVLEQAVEGVYLAAVSSNRFKRGVQKLLGPRGSNAT